ncbi:MAG: VacJ family lipoprotein [Kiritimatiellaeota bacterium]|nr:VacJ family lipoprotein [Kiritimatiellota bacterium]
MNGNILKSLIISAIIAVSALFSFESDAGETPTIQLPQSTTLFSIISPPDSIEGYNRVMFEFNDFVMVWVFRPLENGFSFIIPKTGREHIDMVVVNLEFFIRGISCLLEGEFKGAWVETQRFFINLTLGVVGVFDVAKDWFGLQAYDEDFGQAFASWGIGPGNYFVIPILGPSTVRDAVGEIFFIAFHPITWIPVPGLGAFVFINRMSLRVKSYMSLRDPAFDKYTSLKNLWYLQRKIKIDNLDRPPCE